jgi:FixJ family two-component response regulator
VAAPILSVGYNMLMTSELIVWIIDSQHWPRAYLRAELIERGFEAIGYTHLSKAAAVLRLGSAVRPSAIVLELRDQYVEPRLLDELTGSGIPVILLKGASEVNEPIVRAYSWAAVMRRPFTIGSVADKVQEIVDREKSSRADEHPGSPV